MGNIFFYQDGLRLNRTGVFMNRIKRITMSHLPLEQSSISARDLFSCVKNDMLEFGDRINNEDFMQALFALREEQALVFFDNRKDAPVIATQYGFRIYGTD